MTLLVFLLGCAAALAVLAFGAYRALRGEALVVMRLRRGRWLALALRGERYEVVPLARLPLAVAEAALGGLRPRDAAADEAEKAQVRRVGVGRRIAVPSPHRA